MRGIEKRGRVRQTSEIEMAKEAAQEAVRKMLAVLNGTSKDFRGAKLAARELNRYTRLLNEQTAAARSVIGAVRAAAKHQRRAALKGPRNSD